MPQDRLGEDRSASSAARTAELSTVAWAENAPNMLDHLGNEFLVWLWHTLQNDSDTDRRWPTARRSPSCSPRP